MADPPPAKTVAGTVKSVDDGLTTLALEVTCEGQKVLGMGIGVMAQIGSLWGDGVSLDGTWLRIDHRANESVYGRNTTPRAIFEGRTDPAPDALVEFRDRLEENTVPQD